MESRSLGSTGLVVSRLGLGMAALGRPGYINLHHGQDLGHESSEAAMEHRAHLVLDTAWNTGIRYFDVARSYGRGEEFLGSWIRSRSISRSTVTVGSKWGYTYTADWKIQAQSRDKEPHSFNPSKTMAREPLVAGRPCRPLSNTFCHHGKWGARQSERVG
jgi:aryl-alcohol dehydrogenase-like predicted oxidoreductase